VQCARPCTPIPPLHACSMLTRWTLCCRSLLGRIWESKNIPHIVVGSASRSCGHCWGRGRARKALARGCGRCVLLPCSARRCPARKSPTHALCRRACVNGRGPLGGFHNYILILSNARGLQLDNSPSTLEFPESAADIAPSRVLGARRSCGAQWSWRRLIGSARGSSEHPVIVWYGGSLPRLKLARAGRRHTHLRPISALGGRQIEPSSTPWEALLAAGRPVRGSLSVGRLTRHHTVLGPSPNPRDVTHSRLVYRKTDAPLTRSAAQR
jgi:hypothetical protein